MKSSSEPIVFVSAPRNVVLRTDQESQTGLYDGELEEIRRESYQRGYDDACAYLESQLLAQREDILTLRNGVLETLSREQETLIAQVRDALPSLAIAIVRRLLPGMEPDRETVSLLVAEALHELSPDDQPVEVALSPQDRELFEDLEQGFKHRFPAIRFTADDALQSGDCRIKSRFGIVDGRLATRMERIANALR